MILAVAVATNQALFSYALEAPDVGTAAEMVFNQIGAMLEPGEFVINVVVDPLNPDDEPLSNEVERLLDLRYVEVSI